MSDLKLANQGELFPESSEFHSKHALKKRLAEKAAVISQMEQKEGRPIRDIRGERYGMLTVVAMADEFFNGNQVFICRL